MGIFYDILLGYIRVYIYIYMCVMYTINLILYLDVCANGV